jgi:hypothetical protein
MTASHMKTTIQIPDALLAEINKIAAHEKTALKALTQEGLEDLLSKRKSRKPFKLKDCSVRGSGLNPELKDAAWDDIMAIIYEGRGG